MKLTRAFVTSSFCLCISALYAQEEAVQKQGIFSFGATLSDYNFAQRTKDSSLKYAMNDKDLLKSGKASFGFKVSYWRHLKPHIDLSGNLGVDFSNFPALFVKGDSIGQAKLSVHVAGLAHFMAFKSDARVNPFLTAGLGAGFFGDHLAFFAPIGTGLAFHFNTGSIITLQLQLRKALSSGITNDFMTYSIGFAQGIGGGTAKKHESHKKDEVIKNSLSAGKNGRSSGSKVEKSSREKVVAKVVAQPGTDAAALNNKSDKSQTEKVAKENKVDPLPDADGDGVADKDDKCPDVKGNVENQGCPFPVVEGAEVIKMSPDSATYSIHFDFDQSILQTGAFGVLTRIVEILRSDKTLTINITGHADSQGTDFKNMQVSADRANVTRDYFMSYNVAASRIKSSYYGANRPIDKVQQWRNRRVEVTIIKK